MQSVKPQVLVIAGLDPSGSAGLLADQQALQTIHCHTMALASCLTVQNSRNLSSIHPVDIQILEAQLQQLRQDLRIDAVKIGALGSAEVATWLAPHLAEMGVPVILDPIIKAGSGGMLADQQLQQAIRQSLLPYVTLITPNSEEARILTNDQTLDTSAKTLLALGSQNVLITGGHESGQQIINTLWQRTLPCQSWAIPRHPREYRGTGCRLSTLIAGYLARGFSMPDAINCAQSTLNDMLCDFYTLNSGQHIPAPTTTTYHD